MTNPTVGDHVWYDLLTNDSEGAKAFYTHVVGWKTEVFGDSGYTMWGSEQGMLGGIGPLPEGAPPHWMAHVQVADVDRAAALVEERGGAVHTPPTDIPTIGRFAVVADPQGASLSLFAPAAVMPLHDTNQPGEFSWAELYTSDPEKAVAFYQELLGWARIRDFDMGPMGTYILFGKGGQELGGMMKLPPGMPRPVWGYYVTTADLEAAIERAKAKGGKVLNGPMDVPGNQRVVQMMDPQGAAFAMVTPRPAS